MLTSEKRKGKPIQGEKPGSLRKTNPRRISPARARLTIRCYYFAQQLILIRQQLPPPQQSAEREVALAVPTSARAAMIINRYFMEIPPIEFPFRSRPAAAGRADAIW
jgi:hypothetical protein